VAIVEHLESHLGKIERAWSSGRGVDSVHVVRFPDQPGPGVATYATLGLSGRLLPTTGGGDVRQELVFAAYDRYPAHAIASFLLSFAEFLRSRRRALLRGDVVGPAEPVIPGVPMTAVYAGVPAVWRDGFATDRASTPPTALVWLIPLRPEEAQRVKKDGWNAFEGGLGASRPDLFDLDRPAVV
jgi:hypothetical protein